MKILLLTPFLLGNSAGGLAAQGILFLGGIVLFGVLGVWLVTKLF